MRKKLYALLGTVLACTFIVFACGESEVNLTGPTGNSSGSNQSGIINQGGGDTDTNSDDVSEDEAAPTKPGGRIHWVNKPDGVLGINGGFNHQDGPIIVGLACYKLPASGDRNPALQGEPIAEVAKRVSRGAFTLELDAPLCLSQCDYYFSPVGGKYADGPPVPPLFDSNLLVDAKWVGELGAECFPPPVCVNCGPKKCDPDNVPKPGDDTSEEQECVFDFEKCEWNCDPVCIPEWEVISRVISDEEEWSECAESPPRGEFKQWRWVTLTITQGNQCNEETRENSRRHRETRPCEPKCDLDFRARKQRCEASGGTYTFDVEECTDNCEPCDKGEEITNRRVFFEGECEDRVEVTITEWTDLCTQETRQERTEEPAPEECVPEECIYEYGGQHDDKAGECEALANNAFWSDGSQHCVVPLPGVAQSPWNLTPGQSHPECLRKQDED